MTQNIILVTTDFTPQADNALKHAFILKEKINGRIVLLHIVSDDDALESAHQKIQEIIIETEKNYGIRVSELIRKGNIFDDISKVASEIGAKFVVMGTHGVSGLQHIFGSKALKVISTSKVPFISITKEPKKNGFDKIVMPFNLNKEPSELLRLASDIAKSFDSEIHVLGYGDAKGASNKYLDMIRSYLESSKLSYIIEQRTASNNFDSEVLEYAKSVDADLISISNLQENVFNLFGGFEQNVIANKQGIPVMVVNRNSFGIK
jgi:nucleotide-binding universal stress UspA family protein